ncbi:BlaI/MecI/CopY family transcriptional regulator [bacterium]|nr:BlaI/MecI/CopY family transcriptional regulator [bacterium]
MSSKKPLYIFLSRRESQILDIIYRLGEGSVSDVLKQIPDPPAYNSVRVILTILENKGYLSHRQEGQKYIYSPTELLDNAKKSALKHLVSTFFEGSAPKAVSTLLDMSAANLSEAELNELAQMIEQAKKERGK